MTTLQSAEPVTDDERYWPSGLPCRLTLVPLPVTLRAHLRAAHLLRLRAFGPLGELLARQGQAHGDDFRMNQMGQLYAALPDDLLNFRYDPVACAVALGWPGATVEETHLQLVRDGKLIRFQPGAAGRPARILTDLDPDSFTEYWLNGVEAARPSP